MYFIGIDLGTSAVKLLLTDENGAICGTVSKAYPCLFPHAGWSEQEPEVWYDETVKGVRELLQSAGIAAEDVAALSFGGQMHGLVLLDENDQVIRPAILWNDSRTTAENDYLNTEIGTKRLIELTGNISYTGFTASKILWVEKNEPENFAKIKRIMLPKDYLAYRMTGVCSTDPSDASGMLLFDVKNRKWSDEMLSICHVKEEMLPRIFESYEVTGTLRPEVAEALGLSTGTKVVAGAGDNAASAIGTGTVGNGACNLSLGTSGTLFIASDTFRTDEFASLHAFAHANGKYHLMGCMLSAASANKWWMDEIIGTTDYAGEQAKIREEKLGENHTYFLPYLMGERSPLNDPFARGTFTGMTMDTTRADMTQAVLEGVSFALRDSFEAARKMGVDVKKSTIVGGGAKSPLWKTMLSNILNIELCVPKTEEGPSLGAAMLAGVGAGAFASVEVACQKTPQITDTISPSEELAQKYEVRYQKWKQIYPALKPVFPLL